MAGKKAAVKKAAAKKVATVKAAAVKKTATKKTAAAKKTATVEKAATAKTPATKKTATVKTAATVKKAAAKKSAVAKTTAVKKAATAKKPVAKRAVAKKAATARGAAKGAAATRRPKIDPLRELAWDVDCAFDAEDATPAVQVEFVDGFLDTAKDRGLAVDFDAAVPYCAEVLGLEPGELRATYEGHARKLAAVRGASGQSGELDALVALCATEGRHGASFEDDAARTLREAWPRVGRELGPRLFTGRKLLWLRNGGPFTTLVGFEAASDVRSLELHVTPDCDLTPLAALTRLEQLKLNGKLAGFGALAGLRKLTQLDTEADVTGIAELASLPILRVLSLRVAADVSIAGLVDLKHLNMLILQAGSRPLDDVTAATIAALARKKSRLIRLAQHEGWPLQLPLKYQVTPGYVDINRR